MPRPRIGSIAANTSEASVTGIAPCLSNPFVPSQRGSRGEPGTAKTSRPCSPASRAVIREPDRRAASTMMTPIERRKSTGCGAESRGRAAPTQGASPKWRHRQPRGPRPTQRVRPDARLQGGAVCRRVDAACKTGDDGESRSTEIPCHSMGEFHSGSRSVAGSDDCNLRSREDVGFSTDADQRRRVIDHLQAQRIGRLAQRDVFNVPGTCGL